MKRLLCLVFVVSMVSACGSGASRASSVAALTGVSANGKSVYTNTCASCHQPGGEGDATRTADGGVLYPSLITKAATLTSEAFLGFTINGVPGTSMSSYSSLTDQQLADVYAYVKTL
jgi:mono/diheme cytochrome c family protein